MSHALNAGKRTYEPSGYVYQAKGGLRKKILLHMIGILLLFGLTTALISRSVLLKILKTEFKQKGLSYAESVAANSVVDVLTQNSSRLRKLIDNEKKLDSDISYIFITDSFGKVLAHSFDKGFPVDLAKANKLEEDKLFNIQLLSSQRGRIYDIARHIALEKSLLGQVHIGISKNSIKGIVNKINLIFTGITLFLIAIGILLANRISFLITRPISELIEGVQSIKEGNFSASIDIRTGDEISLLASAFNEMASRLNKMVDEVKQLVRAKERNMLALDLHDSCAQDLANIIKRTELCQKLFKIDPVRAYEELGELNEDARGSLDRARQVIFDLKSPLNNGFVLPDKLIPFIKEYERTNNIAVKLDLVHPVDNIVSAKAKEIFYIIREAFNNIAKHSLAKSVGLRIGIAAGDRLAINIRDDGNGFDIREARTAAIDQRKCGLMNMRERAISLGGAIKIDTVPGQGTEISLDIPLRAKEENITERTDAAG